MFEFVPDEPLLSYISTADESLHNQLWSRVPCKNPESCDRLVLQPKQSSRVIVTFPSGNPPDGATDVPLLNRMSTAEDPWHGLELLKTALSEELTHVDSSEIQPSGARIGLYRLHGIEGATHAFVRPRGKGRLLRFVPTGGFSQAHASDTPDIEQDRRTAIRQTNQSSVSFTDDEDGVLHLLHIQGSGQVKVHGDGLPSEGFSREVHGTDGASPEITRVNEPIELQRHMDIISQVVPFLDDYEKPEDVTEIGTPLHADMMRHIATKALDTEENMSTLRLTRALNLFGDLTEEPGPDGAAYDILQGVFEARYGAIEVQREQEDDEGSASRTFRLTPDAKGWFGTEDSEWRMLFDLRSMAQLANHGVPSSDIVLLENGMRLIRATSCETLDLDRIEKFPHAERIPDHPYMFLRSCFSEEDRENESKQTERFLDVMRNEEEEGYQWGTLCSEGLNEDRALTLKGDVLRRQDGFPMNGWRDLEVAERPLCLVDSNGARLEFNTMLHVSEDMAYVRGNVERVFFLTLSEASEAPRTVPVFHLMKYKPKGVLRMPAPWKPFAEQLEQGRSLNYFRYTLLNDLVRAYLACVNEHQPLPAFATRGVDLLPVKHRRFLRRRWNSPADGPSASMEQIEGTCEVLAAYVVSRIKRDFWLPEECN